MGWGRVNLAVQGGGGGGRKVVQGPVGLKAVFAGSLQTWVERRAVGKVRDLKAEGSVCS